MVNGEQHGPKGRGAADDEVREPISGLLHKALADPPPPEKSLLPGIQRRIFLQSRGRYFADRRQRMRNPHLILLMTALLILAIAAAVFVTLQPLIFDSAGTPPESSLEEPAPARASPAHGAPNKSPK